MQANNAVQVEKVKPLTMRLRELLLLSVFYSPADVAKKVVVKSGQKSNLLLQLFPTLKHHTGKILKGSHAQHVARATR